MFSRDRSLRPPALSAPRTPWGLWPDVLRTEGGSEVISPPLGTLLLPCSHLPLWDARGSLPLHKHQLRELLLRAGHVGRTEGTGHLLSQHNGRIWRGEPGERTEQAWDGM